VNTPIPREFVGLARVFRNRVAAADGRIRAAMPAIIGPLRPRLHRTHRPQLSIREIDDALRAWQSVMDDGLMLDGRLRTYRRSFMVAQLRPTCDRITAAAWEDDETGQPAIALSWHVLQMRGRKAEFTVTPIVTMALHAMARRIERGDGCEDSNIIEDLAPLAAHTAADRSTVAPPPAPPIPAEIPATRGRWAGRWVTARDAARRRDFKVFQVQTFLDDEMEYSNAYP